MPNPRGRIGPSVRTWRNLAAVLATTVALLAGSMASPSPAEAQEECDPATTCSGLGTCDSTGTCSCNSPYAGANCDQCATNYYAYPTCRFCSPSTTCSGRGTCSSSGNCICDFPNMGANCNICPSGRYGPSCTECPGGASNPCGGFGTCSQGFNGSGTCACSAGYSGADCKSPTLSQLSPDHGPEAGGTLLTITGVLFGLGGTVTVGSTSCPVSSWTDTQITCLTPPGSGPQPVVVRRSVFTVGDPDPRNSAPLDFNYGDEPCPADETCNGLDDNCNGIVDDGIRTCGVGACQVTVDKCVDGEDLTCEAGSPAPEKCNGFDDNCDGAIDEGCLCIDGVQQPCYSGSPATLGIGECGTGTQDCQAGVWGACAGDATPGAETCNGLDDDCDGVEDDLELVCGVGACRVAQPACVDGELQSCTPGEPQSEACDGIDNDCDGMVDDGLGQTTCGVGVCEVTQPNCAGGAPQSCTPGTPQAEGCDGIDNDCDGTADDGLGQTTCGVGACRVTQPNCVGGAPQSCVPGTPQPEACDGRDNDCDGKVDEGNPQGGGWCDTGLFLLCKPGTKTCVDGGVKCVPNLKLCRGR